jgi:hypothetical protein
MTANTKMARQKEHSSRGKYSILKRVASELANMNQVGSELETLPSPFILLILYSILKKIH